MLLVEEVENMHEQMNISKERERKIKKIFKIKKIQSDGHLYDLKPHSPWFWNASIWSVY